MKLHKENGVMKIMINYILVKYLFSYRKYIIYAFVPTNPYFTWSVNYIPIVFVAVSNTQRAYSSYFGLMPKWAGRYSD